MIQCLTVQRRRCCCPPGFVVLLLVAVVPAAHLPVPPAQPALMNFPFLWEKKRWILTLLR